jgi:hypothetical protein
MTMRSPTTGSRRGGHRGGEQCAWDDVAAVGSGRDHVVAGLVAVGVLVPLVDYGPSCRLCAAPRGPQPNQELAECGSCRGLARLYERALADLHPISYTTPDGALCAGVRDLKDKFGARTDNRLACGVGAVLSAYLEVQLGGGRLGVRRFDVVTAVPSSRPVVAAALRRAADEGWWSCEFDRVATARPGHDRQRERPYRLRPYVSDKWRVDAAAVGGMDVLVLDDVYTTGGSVHSFAYALRRAGAASVCAVVLARNLWEDDGAWARAHLRASRDARHRWTPSTNKYDVIGCSAPYRGKQALGKARRSLRRR